MSRRDPAGKGEDSQAARLVRSKLGVFLNTMDAGDEKNNEEESPSVLCRLAPIGRPRE